jgi:hypothetical protein
LKAALASGKLFLAVAESDLNQRNNCHIILVNAFELQKIVISTALVLGILLADFRSRMVDRALPRIRIQKVAGLAKDRIGFLAQNAFAAIGLGKALDRGAIIDIEMFCQPFDIAPRNLYALVHRTAIRRTVRAVVVV